MSDKYCEGCGTSVMGTMRFCPQCGHRIFSQTPVQIKAAKAAQTVLPSNTSSLATPVAYIYAGFWERFAAASIDTCIGGLANLLIGFVFGLILTTEGVNVAGTRALAFYYLLGIVVMVFYHSLMESSNKRATFGKEWLGLEVTDYNFSQISLGQGVGRYFGRWLSALLMGLGYFMQPFTAKKQTLHDIMSCTVVVRGVNGKSGMTIFVYALLSFIVMCLLFAVIAAINHSTY